MKEYILHTTYSNHPGLLNITIQHGIYAYPGPNLPLWMTGIENVLRIEVWVDEKTETLEARWMTYS